MTIFRKISVFVAATCSLAAAIPARAITTTTPITNLPQSLSSSSAVDLQFKAFNSTNFPSIWGPLLPNQSVKLNGVKLYTKGMPGGSFTVMNSDNRTAAAISVQNSVYDYKISANNANSATFDVFNQVGTVTRATKTDTSPTTPPVCNAPKIGPLYDEDFSLYYCLTPTTSTFSINNNLTPPTGNNTPNNNVFFELANVGGAQYGPASSYWRTGTVGDDLVLPTSLSFVSDPSQYTNSTVTPSNVGTISSLSGTFSLNSTPSNTYLEYDYDIITNTGVPAPLPLFGAGIGFGFSRRLRRRIKTSSTLAS